MIAVNWGSSNFRAYKLDGAGNIEAERSSGCGAVRVSPEGFPDALLAEIGDWIQAGETKVLMSGMVGARNGWQEAPYIPVPATFDQVADGVIRLEMKSLDARIVPGLIGTDECGVPEVMRGEETEIFGCKDDLDHTRLCLPGTHTKWVGVDVGKIAAFSTSMTGDLYRAIRECTIICNSTQIEQRDSEAFLRGVARSKEPGELAHLIFGVRTLVLTGGIDESSASSYLSGLLIGSEVKARSGTGERVHLIGDPVLCLLYATALREFDVDSSLEPVGAALRGLVRIAGKLKMVMREWLSKCPLISILRGIKTSEVEDVFTELFSAGIVIAEIPLNSPDPLTSIRCAAEVFGKKMLVGAGTVTKVSEVEQVWAAGARLIVSPHADPEVVREAKRIGLIAVPGIGPATEAFAMIRAGADALKLFPADVMGVRMLTGRRAVLPKDTMMVPVGGVDQDTIPIWRNAGADGYGVGSALYMASATSSQVGANARRLLHRLHQFGDEGLR